MGGRGHCRHSVVQVSSATRVRAGLPAGTDTRRVQEPMGAEDGAGLSRDGVKLFLPELAVLCCTLTAHLLGCRLP